MKGKRDGEGRARDERAACVTPGGAGTTGVVARMERRPCQRHTSAVAVDIPVLFRPVSVGLRTVADPMTTVGRALREVLSMAPACMPSEE